MFLLSEIVIPEKCNRMYNNKTSKVKRVSMTRKCHNHRSQINLRHTKEEIPEYISVLIYLNKEPFLIGLNCRWYNFICNSTYPSYLFARALYPESS